MTNTTPLPTAILASNVTSGMYGKPSGANLLIVFHTKSHPVSLTLLDGLTREVEAVMHDGQVTVVVASIDSSTLSGLERVAQHPEGPLDAQVYVRLVAPAALKETLGGHAGDLAPGAVFTHWQFSSDLIAMHAEHCDTGASSASKGKAQFVFLTDPVAKGERPVEAPGVVVVAICEDSMAGEAAIGCSLPAVFDAITADALSAGKSWPVKTQLTTFRVSASDMASMLAADRIKAVTAAELLEVVGLIDGGDIGHHPTEIGGRLFGYPLKSVQFKRYKAA